MFHARYPDLQERSGQPTEQRPGCGFSVRDAGLFHAGTGVLLKLVVAPLLTHDLARVQAVHPSLHRDILVAYRGLCSYALSPSRPAGVHAVLRVGAPRLWTLHGPALCPGVCGGRLLSRAFHDPAGSKHSASMTNSSLVEDPRPVLVPHPGSVGGLARNLGAPRVRYRIGTPGFRTRQITLVTRCWS